MTPPQNNEELMTIELATRATTIQGLPAYYPALVFRGALANGRTIKKVEVFTQYAHATKMVAMKYAAQYRLDYINRNRASHIASTATV